MQEQALSEYRVEKQRAAATLTLAHGINVSGAFFVAGASGVYPGPERIGDLLNTESGFFPFELTDAGGALTTLLNRDHLVTVRLEHNEAMHDPGYRYAITRTLSLLLTTGERLTGEVRVYRPAGRDRLSDWARHGQRFRYVETPTATVIVNVDHIIEAREVQ